MRLDLKKILPKMYQILSVDITDASLGIMRWICGGIRSKSENKEDIMLTRWRARAPAGPDPGRVFVQSFSEFPGFVENLKTWIGKWDKVNGSNFKF